MNHDRAKYNSEKGAILILVAILLTAFFAIVSLCIDVGYAYLQTRRLQTALDAAAVSAANLLAISPVPTNKNDPLYLTRINNVIETARQISEANGAVQAELDRADGIQIGTWTNGRFEEKTSPPFNAVSVSGRRVVSTFFGSMFGLSSLNPPASAVALVADANSADCLIPFAITQDTLNNRRANNTFTANQDGPGNWGKLDIGGNMSSSRNFIEAMSNPVCNPVSVGANFPPAPGFAGVPQGFENRCNLNPIVTMPVIDKFPNGNSSQAKVLGFIVAKITTECDRIQQSGGGGEIPKNAPPPQGNPGKGSNWSIDFELLTGPLGSDRTANPPRSPFTYVLGLAS
jgi:Flp pilus assembly protein TadG